MMFSVNGGWGAWTSWSTCGDNCQKTRSRRCNNPAPVNGEGKKGFCYITLWCSKPPFRLRDEDDTNQPSVLEPTVGFGTNQLLVLEPTLGFGTNYQFWNQPLVLEFWNQPLVLEPTVCFGTNCQFWNQLLELTLGANCWWLTLNDSLLMTQSWWISFMNVLNVLWLIVHSWMF